MRIWNLQNKITIYDGYYNMDRSRCPWNILREKCLHKLQPFILNHRQNDRQYGGRMDQSFQLSILDCLSFLWFICWATWVMPQSFLFFFFFYKWQLLFYKDTPHLNLASHVIQHFNAKTMSGFYCGSDFNYFFFFGVDVFSCMKMYGLTFKGKVWHLLG